MQTGSRHAVESTTLDAAARSLRAGAHLYEVMRTPLYATLCAQGADQPEIVELVSQGRAGAAPMHLFSAVHYLLLRNPHDPLSRYYATLTAAPAVPDTAFAEFVRYCREHRGQTDTATKTAGPIRGEAIVTRYRGGPATRVALARTASDYGSIDWVD